MMPITPGSFHQRENPETTPSAGPRVDEEALEPPREKPNCQQTIPRITREVHR